MSDHLPSRHVFISYSSKDHKESGAIVDQFFAHLRGLVKALALNRQLRVELFVDQDRLKAGDQWDPEIERALQAANLGLLLLSPNFLASDYIMDKELPRLRERSLSEGVRLIPVRLHPCALDQVQWLRDTEVRPRGGSALSEVADAAQLHRVLAQLMTEVSDLLRAPSRAMGADLTAPVDAPPAARVSVGTPPAAPSHSGAPAVPPLAEPPVRLLVATLWPDLGEADAGALARQLVDGVARVTHLSGEALFRAVRFCIEFQLLVADDPASPSALQHFLGAPVDDESARRLVATLRERTRGGDFAHTPIEVNSRFFALTREREALWKRYFDAVLEAGIDERDRERLATLSPIRVRLGFLAPQHLVAGLLSRFDDDWRPVLNAYQRAVPEPGQRNGAFESLQASQWNCWLVWGPSIPICTCSQWRGVYAFQYGYGDENNSLPVVDLADDEHGQPRRLHPVAAGFASEGRGAKWVQLTGRLRWGPWYLREDDGQGGIDQHADDPDIVDADEIGYAPASTRRTAAAAQASLFRDGGLQFRHDSDGITLQVEAVDRVSNERRVYFSAYLWMIFLVCTEAEEPGIGPRLLRGKAWPRWPESPRQREQVREAKLWEHLLPVFVHANVADPAALHFQKRVLAQNAVTLLQQLWQRRAELFDAQDVRAGLRFHLVSASDYSGCGCPVRYPSGTSLVSLMRERLALEPDAEFAAAVALPDTQAMDPQRPAGLAGHFSSCHLPELVGDYFDFVNRRNERRAGSN